jgi:tRNA-dihydrouridine synthase A
MSKINRKVSVAPMMDCTDRHDRYFLRLISKNVMLYSEMISTGAILKGKQRNVLEFSEFEKPVALQLGGSSVKELSEASKIAEDYNYDEVNLNLGCPSKKVQKNKFGACLIKEPDLVMECLNGMVNATKLPVTVKTRIGFDDVENFDYLDKFIKKIASTGVKTIILHARRAILKGLSPRDNLRIPKLNYEIVKQIKYNNPNLEIIINGGITEVNQIKEHLKTVDGVMIGRAIYHSPYFLADIEKEIFNNEKIPTREEVVKQTVEYCLAEVKKGTRVNQVMRHTVGLFHGIQGSNSWKRYLSNNMLVRDADVRKVDHILDLVKDNFNSSQSVNNIFD